jgi:FG-GAP repeat
VGTRKSKIAVNWLPRATVSKRMEGVSIERFRNVLNHQLPLLFACYLLSFRGFAADVLTYHNDNARTGLNPTETILTPQNVNANGFGLIRNLPVDGQVYAQPLYASSIPIFSAGQSQGLHNLLIVATEHDSVYAFDADSGTLYWQVSMLGAGEVPSDPRGCTDLVPEVGITSTPVIDRSLGPNGTLFVLAKSASADFVNYFERLHAIDLSTGQELRSVLIQASYPDPGGLGPNFDAGNGSIIFDAGTSRARAALVLAKGSIYTEWASFCDQPPYSGWVIGYDEATFAQALVLSLDPNGTPPGGSPGSSGNGIWQAGSGAAVDASGNLFLATSNGPFDPGVGDYGDSVLKLSSGLQVLDYFTPFDQQNDTEADTDLGSGGPMILDLADSSNLVHHLLIQAGKDTNLYILDRDHLGKFNPNKNSQIYQELSGVLPNGVWASPAYFNGWIYYGAQNASLLQFQFTNAATLDPVPFSASSIAFAYPGTTPSVSSSGNQNGIVWAYEFGQNNQAILHAYDATNVGKELYNSSQVQIGAAVKFTVPTVCNGKVFVGTANSVAVFGLMSTSTLPPVAKDFNGDGYADLVWENTVTGQRLIWLLKNGVYSSTISLPTAFPGWHIAGVGDFLRNGQSDLVWENTVTGEHVIWILINGVLQFGIELPAMSLGWHVVGAGDFNGDGFADLVLENTTSGQRVIWLLNNGVYSSTISLPTAPPSWHIAGVGDFLGNGQSDLVLENTVTNEHVIWILNKGVLQYGIELRPMSSGWHVAGAADFNGDGNADLVLQNAYLGQRVIWLLNQGVYSSSIALPTGSAQWQIVDH